MNPRTRCEGHWETDTNEGQKAGVEGGGRRGRGVSGVPLSVCKVLREPAKEVRRRSRGGVGNAHPGGLRSGCGKTRDLQREGTHNPSAKMDAFAAGPKLRRDPQVGRLRGPRARDDEEDFAGSHDAQPQVLEGPRRRRWAPCGHHNKQRSPGWNVPVHSPVSTPSRVAPSHSRSWWPSSGLRCSAASALERRPR